MNEDIALEPKIISLKTVEDILVSLLQGTLSKGTRQTYFDCLKHFADYLISGNTYKNKELQVSQLHLQQIIRQFLSFNKKEAIAYCLQYQSALLEADYSPNTINIKIAAVKSLVKHAYKLEQCNFTLDNIDKIPVKTYRDTTGVGIDAIKKLTDSIDVSTAIGARNYAIFRLLWDNGLRRGEISGLTIGDYDSHKSCLLIKGKGQTQKEKIFLSESTTRAIQHWLSFRNSEVKADPLFIALDYCHYGKKLSAISIYNIVRNRAREVGIEKDLSPHQIRHSSITALLDQSNGNVRLAQRFSRHQKLDVLLVYDDNRENLQHSATNILADLI